MLEEENKEVEQEKELNEAIDNSIAVLPLNEQEQAIVNAIVNAPDQKQLEEQFRLFNINQSKKNALRVIKLNSLLGKIEDQAIARFEQRPDQISNKELLEYMQVVANQIDRSQQFIDTLKDRPMIKANEINQNQVNINIGTSLDRDSKERVIDAIQSLLRQLDKEASKPDDVVEVVEPVEGEIIETPLNDEEEGE